MAPMRLPHSGHDRALHDHHVCAMSASAAAALDDARVAVAALLAAGAAHRDQALDDRDLSDTFDTEHALDGFELDRHHAESLIGLARARMEAIHAAYERLADGTYGLCQSCGDGIHPERLVAVPETPWCVECAAPKPEAIPASSAAGV